MYIGCWDLGVRVGVLGFRVEGSGCWSHLLASSRALGLGEDSGYQD